MARAALPRRALAVFTLCALLFAAPVARCDDEDDGDVVVLTTKNFDSVVNKEKIIAVEFYAPWCGHCKSLAPEWKKAAAELKAHDIKLAKVDATEESSLGERFEVRGYPTIKIFRNGKDSEYEGPRQASGIVSYMIDQAAPAARKVSAAELSKLRTALRDDAPEPVVVLFAAKVSDVEGGGGLLGGKASKLGEAFLSAAQSAREQFTFAYTADADAAAEAGVKPGTLAVLHSSLLSGTKSEPAVVPYSGAADASAIEEWLWAASLPRVGELTPRSAPRYARAGGSLVRIALATDWVSDAKGANYLLNRLRRLAAARPALRFAAVKPAAGIARLAEFGVAADAAPFSVTVEAADGAKYASPAPWSAKEPVESVASFLDDLEAGKLEPFVKSEPLPEGTANGVTVLVGKNFDAVGLDDTKDVFIEFYAPWCGHCKSLAPKYEELAQGLASVPSVVVAKLDATANEWTRKDEFAVSGFPTLYLKPAKGGAILKYEGPREAADMAAWLAENAVTPFEVPAALRAGGAAAADKKKKKKRKAAAEASHGDEL